MILIFKEVNNSSNTFELSTEYTIKFFDNLIEFNPAAGTRYLDLPLNSSGNFTIDTKIELENKHDACEEKISSQSKRTALFYPGGPTNPPVMFSMTIPAKTNPATLTSYTQIQPGLELPLPSAIVACFNYSWSSYEDYINTCGLTNVNYSGGKYNMESCVNGNDNTLYNLYGVYVANNNNHIRNLIETKPGPNNYFCIYCGDFYEALFHYFEVEMILSTNFCTTTYSRFFNICGVPLPITKKDDKLIDYFQNFTLEDKFLKPNLKNQLMLTNPVNNDLIIQFISYVNTECNITLIDNYGTSYNLINQSTVNLGFNSFNINLNNFSSGIYFLRFNTGTESFCKKFVKL